MAVECNSHMCLILLLSRRLWNVLVVVLNVATEQKVVECDSHLCLMMLLSRRLWKVIVLQLIYKFPDVYGITFLCS